ncbi:PORR domain-containing protein [Citrus sinensis]|uniref:PORR domain-containing protein n=1 Tax=Citrus sinensis TaxID=2711 RepID=A0ACB8KT67_CITSI|nr:PORR domain-containing protein [Citrus sinensis]
MKCKSYELTFSVIGLVQETSTCALNSVQLLHIVFNPMADEEIADPKKYLEEACKPKCVKSLIEYEACIKRIEADDTGSKHCTGQYFDYLSCVDKCVAPKLFTQLK